MMIKSKKLKEKKHQARQDIFPRAEYYLKASSFKYIGVTLKLFFHFKKPVLVCIPSKSSNILLQNT